MRGKTEKEEKSDASQPVMSVDYLAGCGTMMNVSSDEGSDTGGPALPAGVLKSSTAWGGDNLELEHKRQRIRQGQDVAAAADHTAVDINQFRNVEVGSGYQAQHVVRQRTGNDGGSSGGAMKVRDMTGGASAASEGRSTSDRDGAKGKEKRKDKDAKASDKSSKRSRKHKAEKDEQNIADQYLKCKGVREFRLELEKILSSA